ncbi:hypothetical protein ACOK4R_36175 (plasmid) [Pseudomonas fluorescens]|uniref:hypothetical protein n=1 Tax=Pseudomonas fluorescens TaxID=294 RepID=UPI001FD4E997|nr:hypothetical protein [Pseudomonas fluorescens]
MQNLFRNLPNEWMAPGLRKHADLLCEHINLFLTSMGKNPDRTICLVDFMKKKELAREYCEIAGEKGWPVFDIDHFIADDWLAGYWAWIEDGGTNAMLRAVEMDAPRRTVVLRDLINLGVGGIYRSMGLLRSREAFQYTVGFCRHLFSAATKDDIEDAIGQGNPVGRMAVVSLSKYLQTKQFKADRPILNYNLESISVLVGSDEVLFSREFFNAKEDVYRRMDAGLAKIQYPDKDLRGGLNLVERLSEEYRVVTAADSDAYGRLARPRQTGKCLHPVIMPRLYECVETGNIDDLWRITLGRCSLITPYFPTKGQPTDDYVKAALSLMVIRDVEATMGIQYPRQEMLNALDEKLAGLWGGYESDERETIMAVLCTIGYGANIDVYKPTTGLGRALVMFDILVDTDAQVDVREQALKSFAQSHLRADYRLQLWPVLIANAKAVSHDPLLRSLQPHLALAWHWGQSFHYAGNRTQLYGPMIIKHDGWKNSLAKDAGMTAKALTLANGEKMLDPKFAASLEVSGEVLRMLDFKLPPGLSDRAMAIDLGL